MTDTVLTLIALGQGAAAAELFAAREFVALNVADTVREVNCVIRRSSGPVLLSLGEGIGFRELAQIMRTAHDANVSCGFIDSWRGREASVRHARNILAWSPSRPPGIVFWNSDRTTTGHPGIYSNLHIVEHDAEIPEAILGESRRTLGMISHGNGIDASFGQGFLCGRLGLPSSMRLENYFPCGQGGRCTRGTFIDGEFKDPRRYSTADLGGDVVVWGTCFNVLMADAIFDPRGGLLAGLLEKASGDRTRQVITVVRAVEPDDVAILAACARIEAGETLGSVVTGLNEIYLQSAPQGALPPWILFGDPTSRIDSDHSVAWSADGAEARPGLSLLHLPAGRDSEVTLLVKEPADTPADLWVRRVGGSPEGVLLRRDDGLAVSVTTVVPGTEELAFLRRRMASAEMLTFSDMLFRIAAGKPAAAALRYDPSVAGHIQETLQYVKALNLSPRPYENISGDSESFASLLTAERDSWRQINEKIFQELIHVLQDFGTDIHPNYNIVPPSLTDSATLECPYCKSPAELLITRFPGPISARSKLQCDRCQIVSDADERYGTVLLQGPASVTTGQLARYSLHLTAVPEYGVEFGCARLFVRRRPWPIPDLGSLAVLQGYTGPGVLNLDWTPAADLPPGRYYLAAPMVLDGAIFVTTRPVLIE